MNINELKDVLAKHAEWLVGSGNSGQQANLSEADLREANLREVDLRWANLHWANLREADLRWANLSEADLREANLREANLREADLSGANLSGANLSGANLRWANLSEADLREADLSGANLSGANLREADLRHAKNIPKSACEETTIVPAGALRVFKKLRNGVIAELEVPPEAKRSNATSRKCRSEYVVCISGSGESSYDSSATYEPGKIVRCNKWDEDRWNECGGGIHFFLTRGEAERYQL